MAKCFKFSNPEQLKEVAVFCKEGNVLNTARVWSVTCRQKERTPWDGKICVSFSSEGRERRAVVYRIGTGGEHKELAKLKYAPALAWCSENLSRLD